MSEMEMAESSVRYGSDAIALQLSRLGIDYLAMVPGSTYKGLHDSIVNFNGNVKPTMLVCLHEEHTVHIAQAYAKVARKPMGVALHANVGLMHATMAIYNAFCDRVPMLILGATGPVDTYERRPWIDWVHSSLDQGALIRPFIKLDDLPLSANAAVRSITHATVSTIAKPCAPTYVCLDSALQEAAVEPASIKYPDTGRYLSATASPGPSKATVDAVLEVLTTSKRPLFLMGRVSTEQKCWDRRIQVAERLKIQVLTDLKQVAAFPTAHKLHPVAPSVLGSPEICELIRNADVIISLDWVDLAGTLKAAYGGSGNVDQCGHVVHVSVDSALHNGWSQDHFALPPVDTPVYADPDEFVSALLQATTSNPPPTSAQPGQLEEALPVTNGHSITAPSSSGLASSPILMSDLSSSIYAEIPPDEMCLVRIPLSWTGSEMQVTHHLGYLGADGGAGLASGPANVVGAALALQDIQSPLLAAAVLGDGDFLMGCTALWTAASHKIPLLVIVANNRSFFNDELHQERMATKRTRPVENRWIGMRLDEPAPDLHAMSEGLGCTVVRKEQVTDRTDLRAAIRDAAKAVRSGKSVVLDVHVSPEGYRTALETGKPASR